MATELGVRARRARDRSFWTPPGSQEAVGLEVGAARATPARTPTRCGQLLAIGGVGSGCKWLSWQRIWRSAPHCAAPRRAALRARSTPRGPPVIAACRTNTPCPLVGPQSRGCSLCWRSPATASERNMVQLYGCSWGRQRLRACEFGDRGRRTARSARPIGASDAINTPCSQLVVCCRKTRGCGL